MKRTAIALLGFIVSLSGAACGGGAGTAGGTGPGKAAVTIGDKSFQVNNVTFRYETGEGGYFRFEGDDAANANKDCVPGLDGGIAVYGDLPSDVTSLADLSGKELPFEFTGDGDDANLCFVGSNGLLGVEQGTVRFTSSDAKQVAFSFSGSFVIYDGQGGQGEAPVTASGTGVASITAQ